ncbi:MAG: hypothetical protein K9N47_18315 [Prosthecobacter sp.]|uniref:hypothetical protein n=1 Tax=Prosthecobacter sp. TaxID=1965333 RepID=UPI0025E85D38|nr:hypothetical protein [Prosthecobacter sp.]MCF7788083.1 hypothetical protein [Prosthecobacter sp.]
MPLQQILEKVIQPVCLVILGAAITYFVQSRTSKRQKSSQRQGTLKLLVAEIEPIQNVLNHFNANGSSDGFEFAKEAFIEQLNAQCVTDLNSIKVALAHLEVEDQLLKEMVIFLRKLDVLRQSQMLRNGETTGLYLSPNGSTYTHETPDFETFRATANHLLESLDKVLALAKVPL